MSDSNCNTIESKVKKAVKMLDPTVKHQIQILEKLGCTRIGLPDVTCDDERGEPIIVENKNKPLFEAGSNYPYDSIGLNLTQFHLRYHWFQKARIRTLLVNEVPDDGTVYYEYLDVLVMKGEFWDSPGGIRLFPAKNFRVLEKDKNQ